MDSAYLEMYSGCVEMNFRYLRGTLGTSEIESGHFGVNSIHLEIDYIHLEMDSRDQNMVVKNL